MVLPAWLASMVQVPPPAVKVTSEVPASMLQPVEAPSRLKVTGRPEAPPVAVGV